MKKIILIYFKGCPGAEKVKAALKSIGLNFHEIVQNELSKDDAYRNYSSPSVVAGNDLVYGIRSDANASSCTFDSANFYDDTQLICRLKELKAGY